MRLKLRGVPNRTERLKNAIREACSLSAVIKKTEFGLVIKLSDGRVCTVSDDLWRPGDDAMTAAMQWAQRHGASSVEICD
jgi:hypothetical protein